MAADNGFPKRSFLLYWRAQAVSEFGTYITLLALQTLVVVTMHGSAQHVGWLNSARWLPYLVVGVVVGAVVDRYRRRPVMIATDLVQAALLGVIPLLWWLGVLAFPALVVIVVAYGTASVVSSAASQSFVPRLVEREHLQRAHARTDGSDAVAMAAGPGVGGLLVQLLGAPLAILVDAVTFAYSAITLSRVDLAEPPSRGRTTAGGLTREVLEGTRWAYGRSGLAALAIATHGWFVGNAVVGVVMAPYIMASLALSPFQFGVIGAVGGLGALVGSAITTRVGLRLGTGRTIIACDAVNAVGVMVMFLAGNGYRDWVAVSILAAGQALYGLAVGMSNSHEMSYRQLVTPDELQARTNSTLRSVNRAVMVVVAPVAGFLADGWGLRPMLLVAAATFAVVSAGLWFSAFRDVRAPV